MEKTSILDFVTKLSELANGKQQKKETATNGKQSELKSDGQENSTCQNSAKKLGEDANNSFLKSYNPFGEIQKNRPQLSMPKAPKPTKNTIDLSGGKAQIKNAKSSQSKNVIDLINRHNAFLLKIKK